MGGTLRWRRVAALALVGAAAIALALAWSWWRAGGEPEYWASFEAQHQALEPAERELLADQAEHRVLRWWSGGEDVTPTSGPPADDAVDTAPSSIELGYELINTWLNERGEAWLVQQGGSRPAGLEALAVAPAEHEHELIVAAKLQPLGGRIVSAHLRLDDDEADDERVRLTASRLRLGRLPVPAAVVGAAVGSAPITALLNDGLSFEPVWRVDETRRARLLDVQVDDEHLAVTIAHEAMSDEDDEGM